MIYAENKIQYLKKCLGAKKLKQLGLIPCSTCSEIVTQVSHISPPPHLKDKPFLNAEENVTLASQFAPARRKRVQNPQQHAQSLLKQLGLAAADTQRLASQLSVGQQQRVAAARALFGAPSLIIADEPTSALDAEHRDEFIQVLFKACAANQTTLLFVTHDQGLAPMFERTIELSDINHARKDDGDA